MKTPNQKNPIIAVSALIGCIVIIIALAYGYATQKTSPEKIVKNFYESWTGYSGNPMANKLYQNNKYLTEKLEADIQDTIDSFDKVGADPVLCAQDKPQSMSFELTRQTDSNAIVEITEDFGGNSQVIKAGLKMQDKKWLIDEIICTDKITGQAVTKETNMVGDYIRDHISELSPEKEVLGGTFYVTEITFPAPNIALIEYEDGHIALTAEAEYEIKDNQVKIKDFEIIE